MSKNSQDKMHTALSMNTEMYSRRAMLKRCSSGFGMMAFGAIHNARLIGSETNPFGPRKPHFPAKAKHVILCYMSGGASHIDSFDYKPRLKKEAGKPMPVPIERTQFNQNGNIQPSPWAFKKYGQSGIEVSDLFPQIGSVVDEIAVVKSMTASFSEHAQGNFFMHTGFPFLGHPSAGAWASYGLGTESENLPGYVVLRSGGSGIPHGGVGLFSSGFLPAYHQASIINASAKEAVPNIQPGSAMSLQRRELDFIKQQDEHFTNKLDGHVGVESAIKNYEMAFRMQASVPELVDISGESKATKEMYGMNDKVRQKAEYGKQCLLARRLVERGVRFVELTCLSFGGGGGGSANPWDHHGGLKQGHGSMGHQVDQPIAALIKDLKQRGLLDETLVIWAGEFGRTPFSQGRDGRDHNPYGFSIFIAGGGIKGGTVYGSTDEYGYYAIENKTTVYDMWATTLHQMGIRHEDLTYRHGGRDFRLTDVHGNVWRDLLI